MKNNETQQRALEAMALFEHIMEQLRMEYGEVGFADTAEALKDFGETISGDRQKNGHMQELESQGGGGTNDLEGIGEALALCEGGCPGPDSNQHGPFGPWDFKSHASTSSATRALGKARGGIEPPYRGFADLCITTLLPRRFFFLSYTPFVFVNR